MDKATRNTLRITVTQCRRILEDAVAELLEGQFGIHRDGMVEPAARMTHLSDADRAYREQVARYLEHLRARSAQPSGAAEQLIREVAFTHLNRLCAYKMLEKRGLIRQTVSRGLDSNGFKFYLADHPDDEALWRGGEQDRAYRHFLEWTGRTLAQEIGILFAVHDPSNRLFPPQRILDDVLARLNDPDLASIWDEDETIGWIYQYFTPRELRDEARKASQAPRNSYELAFRNQFYTPRYVVEFLVDNTLGRMWWEMRRGQTSLASVCRYLIRRPHPIWLTPGEKEPEPFSAKRDEWVMPGEGGGEMWTRPNPAENSVEALTSYALSVDGYTYAQEYLASRLDDNTLTQEHLASLIGGGREDFAIAAAIANGKSREYGEAGKVTGSFEELRICLFFEQRRQHHFGESPSGETLNYWHALHCAICEAWDREAELVPYREKRDPRELRILDPACGSGHFLLYCFDLLIRIYQEAWEDDDLGPALKREFSDDFPAYQAAVPAMILRHNLHGVDIDLRATQIAALALWLRAQREYADLSLTRERRPPIRRSNIVYAEPMPGEYDLLQDFLRTLDPPALVPLVREVWLQMKLAGEAGSLLPVERALRDEIARAKREWISSGGGNIQLTMFEQGEPPKQETLNFTGVSDVAFYEREAEPRVLDALRRFAEAATNGGGDADETGSSDGPAYTRRLFVEDAARGFALVELLEKQYSVVLMNPPFGEPSIPSKAAIEKAYPRTKNDLYAAFVERGLQLLYPAGRLGAITSRTGFFLTSFQKWREEILLGAARPVALADLGYGVLDTAMVETAAYVLEKGP
jgi:Eco57I restriction-modification methylase